MLVANKTNLFINNRLKIKYFRKKQKKKPSFYLYKITLILIYITDWRF